MGQSETAAIATNSEAQGGQFTVKTQDLEDLAFIAHELAQPDHRPILARKRLAERLLSLFRADFLGQTQWNGRERRFEKPLCYNRDQDMSWAYESHYQFCDPFSHRIRPRRDATPVYEVISRAELERTEYHADFLRPYRVAHGLDLYLYEGERNIGDLRIWRRSADRAFSRDDKRLLNALRPMLKNAYQSMLSGDLLEEAVSGSEFMLVAASADLRRRVASPALLRWIAEQPGLTEQAVLDTVIAAIAAGRDHGSYSRFEVTINRRDVSEASQCAFMCTVRPKAEARSGEPLSARELQVGVLVARGLTDREIADELDISYWTVRTHVGNLLRKLEVRNRVELARRPALSRHDG